MAMKQPTTNTVFIDIGVNYKNKINNESSSNKSPTPSSSCTLSFSKKARYSYDDSPKIYAIDNVAGRKYLHKQYSKDGNDLINYH